MALERLEFCNVETSFWGKCVGTSVVVIAFHMVVINVCLYNKICYVWFVDTSQCHSVLRE